MDIIDRLHATWCREANTPLPLDGFRRHAWEEWFRYIGPAIAASEWPKTTPEQLLELVVVSRRKAYRSRPEIAVAMLKFPKITGSPDTCFEDWAHEMASRRPRPSYTPGKADAMRATGRPDEPPAAEARLSGDVLKGALEQLRASVGGNIGAG